jgi:hypothetical protein
MSINFSNNIQSPIYSISSIDYQNNITIPNDGEIIIIYDYKVIDGKNVPGFIIGDGITELKNLFVDVDYVDLKLNTLDSKYVLKTEIEQLIKQGIEDYFNENPDEPTEPDEPAEPEEPTGSIGSITKDNSIVIDETQLENGTYTLKYIDYNENIIDNFNEITSFEINKE